MAFCNYIFASETNYNLKLKNKIMSQKNNWIQNPTKTQFIISFTVYVISLTIFVAAMTDFFQKPFDLKVNVVLLLLNVFATITMLKVMRNYFKNMKNR
jgi:uncharacterized membrane-anchored protein